MKMFSIIVDDNGVMQIKTSGFTSFELTVIFQILRTKYTVLSLHHMNNSEKAEKEKETK